MYDFSEKTVFVAGGTSGINLAIAEAFARASAKLYVISRSEQKVAAACETLLAAGGDAFGMSADVRDDQAVAAAFADCAARLGEIDVLVSGAAGNFPAKALDISSNGFRSVLEIDTLGTHHVMRAAWPHLKKPGASVINISAPQAAQAMIGQAHVCAAKAGIDMITKTLALEWGPDGVRVNSVAPGPIAETEGMKRLASGAADLKAIAGKIPLRRLGACSEVADLCLFLASERAAYISGTVIPIDGGFALNATGDWLDGLLS